MRNLSPAKSTEAWNVPRRSTSKERRALPQKQFELVVMQPVARILHTDHAAVMDHFPARVGLGHGQETLQSPEKKNRARDLTEQLRSVVDAVAVWRKQPREIVEF